MQGPSAGQSSTAMCLTSEEVSHQSNQIFWSYFKIKVGSCCLAESHHHFQALPRLIAEQCFLQRDVSGGQVYTVHACTCTHTCAHMHAFIHARAHMHTHVSADTHAHTHTHTMPYLCIITKHLFCKTTSLVATKGFPWGSLKATQAPSP